MNIGMAALAAFWTGRCSPRIFMRRENAWKADFLLWP